MLELLEKVPPGLACMEHAIKPISMLVVDDHEPTRVAFCEGLKQLFNCQVEAVDSGPEALRFLEQAPVDLVITTHQLPRVDSLALATEVRQLYPRTALILVAHHSSSRLNEQAARLGIRHVLIKPIGLLLLREVIFDALRDLLDEATARNERHMCDALEHWIGQQAAYSKPDLMTREVMNLLEQWNQD
jgi:CheY-like chemotaxis protein